MGWYFKNDDFQFGLEIALGASARGAADAGEVLATASRIKNGDTDSWLEQWLTTGEEVRAAGAAAAELGHRASALSCFLRAATYYATALSVVTTAGAGGRQLELWREQRACWDRAVDLFPTPGERVSIAYEQTTLPGYFFPAPGSAPRERRPLIVMNNGSDGATSEMWAAGGAAASERGYHWMTFDGPGQQAALFDQRIRARPDWEAVLTPVLDAMLARPDVDPGRVAVVGVSQAGFCVPRALCFEHRFAAAVADPGVVDVLRSWTSHLPPSMVKQLEAGKQAAFDREMHLVERFSPSTRAALDYRGQPYGIGADTPYDLYQEVKRYVLGDELAQLQTPLLITAPEEEQFWPGQATELSERVGGHAELLAFTAAEGSARHCEPLSPLLRDARVFDWLAAHLAPAS